MDAARARATANSRSARTAVHLAAVAAALALVGATEGLRHDPMTVLAALPRQAWLLLGADAAPVPARNLGEQEEVAASPTSESPATTQAVETVAADPVTLATTEAPSPQAQEPPSAVPDSMSTTNNSPELSPSATISPEASTEVAPTQAAPSETTVPATLLPSPSTAYDPSVPSKPVPATTDSPPILPTVTGLPDERPTSGGYETVQPAASPATPPPTRGPNPAKTTTKWRPNNGQFGRPTKRPDVILVPTLPMPEPPSYSTDLPWETGTMYLDILPTGTIITPGVRPQSRPAQDGSAIVKPTAAAATASAAPVFIEVLPTAAPAASANLPDSTDPVDSNAPPGTRPSRVHIPGQTYDSSDPWASEFGGLGGSGSSAITRTVLISAVGVTIAAIVLVVVGILVTRHRKAQNRRAGLGRSATIHRAPSAVSGDRKPEKGGRKPPAPIQTDAGLEAQQAPYSPTSGPSDFAASAAWIATPTSATMLVPPHAPIGRKKTVTFVTPPPPAALLNRTWTGSTARETVSPVSQTNELGDEAMVAEDSTLGEDDDTGSQISLLSGPSAMSIRDVQLDKGGRTLVALTSGVERGQLRIIP